MSRVEHIGDATLYLGDCRDFIGLCADALLTDPPYGVGFTGKATKHTDNTGNPFAYPDTPDEFYASVLPRVNEWISAVPRAAVFCGTRMLHEYPKPTDIGGIVCPNGVGMSPWGFGCYHPLLFYGRSPYLEKGMGSRPTATAIYHPGMHVTGEDQNPHPCPKPILFMLWAAEKASLPRDVIIDPFMGSGTTGVAALRLGRKFIGIEIEERWFDIACRRIEQEARQGKFNFTSEVA